MKKNARNATHAAAPDVEVGFRFGKKEWKKKKKKKKKENSTRMKFLAKN
jgi:hypothetical protein